MFHLNHLKWTIMFLFFSTCAEEDLLDSKAHTYPRRRSHTIGSSNVDYNDGMSSHETHRNNKIIMAKKPTPVSVVPFPID